MFQMMPFETEIPYSFCSVRVILLREGEGNLLLQIMNM